MTRPGSPIKGFSSRPVGFPFSDPRPRRILGGLRNGLPAMLKPSNHRSRGHKTKMWNEGPMLEPDRPFWKVKTLEEMTPEEWERKYGAAG